jgi:GNAT superfamily N-acetyltransferase
MYYVIKAQVQVKPYVRTVGGKFQRVRGFARQQVTGITEDIGKEFFNALKMVEGKDWMFEEPDILDLGDKINIDVNMWTRDAKPEQFKGLKKYNKPGYIGHFELNFFKDGEHVYLNSLFLKDEWQGKGIGNDTMKRAIDFGISKGFKKFSLMADGDVGVYAWAIQGWDWNTPKEKKQLLEDFCKWLKKRYNVEKTQNDFLHAWDVAAFMIGDKKVGKEFMMGEGKRNWWNGTLFVGRYSKGYEIFKEYHRLRHASQSGRAI